MPQGDRSTELWQNYKQDTPAHRDVSMPDADENLRPNSSKKFVHPAAPKNILEMRSISKFFFGFGALRQVDFEVRQGEVHIVLGENGAGKSTLMKIMAGVYPYDAGQMLWKGQQVHFNSPLCRFFHTWS